MRSLGLICALTVMSIALTAAPSLAARPVMMMPNGVRTVQWHPGVAMSELQSAQVIRIAPGFRRADLALLRDDQVIETPSGRRVDVRKLRLVQQAVAEARAMTAVQRPAPFKILPPTYAPCVTPGPNETEAQILARPPGQAICTPTGRSVSVAQLRLIAPFVQQRAQRPQLFRLRPVLTSGPAIAIASRQDLRMQFHTNLKNAPDSTVLVSPKGTRVTIGQLKALLKTKATSVRPIRSMGGRVQ